jgi:hypothetical protein
LHPASEIHNEIVQQYHGEQDDHQRRAHDVHHPPGM